MVITWMRHLRRVPDARRAGGQVAVHTICFDERRRIEEIEQFIRGADAGREGYTPHQLGEFVVRTEDDRDVAWKLCCASWCTEHAGRGAFEHHRLVAVGKRACSRKHGPAAHRMALETDSGAVHH